MVQHLFFSQDLTRWTYLRPFVEDDIFTLPGEDGAAPYFWPIGDKHILIFASHVSFLRIEIICSVIRVHDVPMASEAILANCL